MPRREVRIAHLAPEGVVFLLALTARLALPLLGGGVGSNTGYDPGVYYAGAAGLVAGRVPYRDFLLVHPPMIVYTLAPFAWLGRAVGDHAGFVLANLAFEVLAAVNAVLVVRLARAVGLGRGPALAGGLFYALWFGAVAAEYSTRLEPLGNTFVLCAMLALANADRSRRPVLWSLLAGAAFGAALSTKIWWVAVLAVVVAWLLLVRRAFARVGLMAVGFVAVALVADLPLLLLSHGRMWTMVVEAQLGRHAMSQSLSQRLGFLLTVRQADPSISSGALHAALVVGGVVAVAVLALAVAAPPARLFAAVAVVQVAVLLAAPSIFSFYADYLTVAAALVLAGAAHTLSTRRRVARAPAVAAVALPLLAVTALTAGTLRLADLYATSVPHRHALVAAARHQRCVMSDYPNALIQLDALSRSFRGGCRNLVDITALQIGAAGPADVLHRGRPNPRWSHDLADYLLSGDATIPIRPQIGLTGDAKRTIAGFDRLAGRPPWALYRVPPAARTRAPGL